MTSPFLSSPVYGGGAERSEAEGPPSVCSASRSIHLLRKRGRISGALAAATFAFLTPAFAESLVIVEARGVALKPGGTVDSTKPLVLKQGQHVTLISNSGNTLVLDGPYNQPPAIKAGGTGGNVIATLIGGGTRTSEVGTTRGTLPAAKLPSPWLIDVSRAGNACLIDGETAVLWRPSASGAATLSMMPDDRSWRIVTQWPAGQDRIEVASRALIHGGVTYLVTYGASEAAVRVNAVPADLSSDAMRTAWLANKGCEAQALALLKQ